MHICYHCQIGEGYNESVDVFSYGIVLCEVSYVAMLLTSI